MGKGVSGSEEAFFCSRYSKIRKKIGSRKRKMLRIRRSIPFGRGCDGFGPRRSGLRSAAAPAARGCRSRSGGGASAHQHRRVAVAQEAEVVGQGVVVDLAPPLARIGRDEQQQRRFGLVEVGDDVAHDAEAVVERRDHDLRGGFQPVEAVCVQPPQQVVQRLGARVVGREVVGFPLSHRLPAAGVASRADAPGEGRERFEGAHRRGAHGRNRAPLGPEGRQRVAPHLEVLGVHGMACGVALLDGQEGAGAHVERDLLEPEAPGAHRLDQLGREVQPRGRCRDRAFVARVDGLVARVVDLLALAVEVGRNGNAAQQFEQLAEREVGRPLETHGLLAPGVRRAPRPQALLASGVRKADFDAALLPFPEVAHDAAPLARAPHGEGTLVVGRGVRFEAEDLDAGARGLVHDDAGADYLRVVEHQQLAGGQHVAQVAEAALRDAAVAPHQQLRIAALRQGEFRDPLRGKRVVVVFDVDVSFHKFACSQPPFAPQRRVGRGAAAGMSETAALSPAKVRINRGTDCGF